MKEYILKPVSLEYFDKWIEKRKPFVCKNEYINWKHILEKCRTEKCSVCGKIGWTVLMGRPDSAMICTKCKECYEKTGILKDKK